MYINKTQLEQRLEGTSVLIKQRIECRGRTPGSSHTHDERVLAGILAEHDTCKNIGELMDMSPSQVSNHSRGLASYNGGVDRSLKEEVNKGIARKEDVIKELAIETLTAAISSVSSRINNEPIKLTDTSRIAVDMSKILNGFNPDKTQGGHGGRVFIINAPARRREDQYEQLIVQEKAG